MSTDFNFPDEVMDINTPPARILHTAHVTCRQCGKEFDIPPVEQKFFFSKGYTLPKNCPECRKKKREVQIHTCIDCGGEFELTGSQINYFNSKGYSIPKRCPECIRIKKEKNTQK